MITPTVIIVAGIPTSGKSTWINKFINRHDPPFTNEDFRRYRVVSRDAIRLDIFGKNYKQNSKDEKTVTELYDFQLKVYIDNKVPLILDNTHCKESYLNQAIDKFKNTDYKVIVKFFEVTLWQAFWRNIKRYIKTGKYIPWKVIKQMKKNFDKINKEKYPW